jgi:hypothetical protein
MQILKGKRAELWQHELVDIIFCLEGEMLKSDSRWNEEFGSREPPNK